MIRRSLSLRLLAWTALILGVGVSSTLFLLASSPPQPERDPPAVPSQRLVCLGFVDVEGGLIELSASRAGRVIVVGAQEGQHVDEGELLLRLEDGLEQARTAQARSALHAAEIRLELAQRDLTLHPTRLAQQRATVEGAAHRLAAARSRLRRLETLVKSRLADEADVEAGRELVAELERMVEGARARLTELEGSSPRPGVLAAQVEVESARSRLSEAMQSLAQLELRAPEAGTIVKRSIRRGEVITAASPPQFQLRPAHPLVVRADLEQEFVSLVRPGQKALIEYEERAGVVAEGEVVRLSEVFQRRRVRSDPSQFTDVPTVECLIRLNPGSPPLPLGMRVRVTLLGREGR